MARRNGELTEELKIAAVPSSVVGDALLFTTICIIGMPVEVYAKDGSVYSGIFHTASVDKNYAIVLKKARMIEKGSIDSNVVSGSLIETLVVQSEDLVQVVAKSILLPSNGIAVCAGNGTIEAAEGCSASDKGADVINPNESKGNRSHMSHRSSTAKAANHLGNALAVQLERLDTIKFVKTEGAHDVSVDRSNVEDGNSLQMHSDAHKNPEFHDMRDTKAVQATHQSINNGQAPSMIINVESSVQQEPKDVSSFCSDTAEDQGRQQPTSDENAFTAVSQPNVSIALSPMVDAKSNSCLKASSRPFLFVHPKSSSLNIASKDSKLNPGAKIFSPSLLHHRTTCPVAPNVATVPYMPGNRTIAAPQEVDASSFTHSSVPVKLVPYNNVTIGYGGHDATYVQPILGQVNRMQPTRYTGQYQGFQMGPPYVQPNPPNVLLGRTGPLVCMHPMANDVVQSAAGFPPVATRPIFTKHQGNVSAQALQLCMNPEIMATGPQQFVMPTAVPISQPIYPVLQHIAVPGTNGFLNTKYA